MGASAISKHAIPATLIGLVAALPAEAACLGGRLCEDMSASLGPHRRLLLSGVGPDNARRAATRLADEGVTALISWGSAGGLHPDMPPGALLLPKFILTVEGRTFAVTEDWRSRIQQLMACRFTVYEGGLLQSSQPVTTVEQKKALFARTAAVAVDMESAAIAEVALSRGLSFVAVRAVLDPSSRSLPRSVTDAVDANGSVRMRALVMGLMRRPSDVARTFQLWTDLRHALSTLQHAARLAKLEHAS
jgi:adenosylhomocysteine nucleosidase